jgi:porphobilinogen synthase
MNHRPRILRKSAAIRSMVAETSLSPSDFIAPLFIVEGAQVKEEISSLPNYFRMSLDETIEEAKTLWQLGIKSVLLFVKCNDEWKDNAGTEALNPQGLMQRAIRAIKSNIPEMVVITDVALDPYSSFGHDGIVEEHKIVNDKSVEVLARMALSHAQAGADFVAPSDMMDGRVAAIRSILEANSFHETGILSYSVKYASCLYGPFRDALDSAPGFGDKKTYQMDSANSHEAVKEAVFDAHEGADIVMVKPAGFYLDVIYRVGQAVNIPVAAYQVSGEYAMIKAAAAKGWVNEEQAMLESLTAIKRAGATVIASYFAKQFALYFNNNSR